MKNILKKIFGVKKPEVIVKEHPRDVLRREIETRRKEELARLILENLPEVQVFELGPGLPKEGKFLKTIKFSEIPEGVKIDLLKYGQDSSCSGLNPANWSGVKWVIPSKIYKKNPDPSCPICKGHGKYFNMASAHIGVNDGWVYCPCMLGDVEDLNNDFEKIIIQLQSAAEKLNISEVSEIFEKNGGVPQNSGVGMHSTTQSHNYGHYNSLKINGKEKRFFVSITCECDWNEKEEFSYRGGSYSVETPRGWIAKSISKIEIIPSLTGREHEKFSMF